jgi:hypothetical protein
MMSERDAIQSRIDDVRGQLGTAKQGRPANKVVDVLSETRPSKRNLSEAARQRIADAQKRRWAKARAAAA